MYWQVCVEIISLSLQHVRRMDAPLP